MPAVSGQPAFALNLAYNLSAALLLLLAPEVMKTLFAADAGIPIYIARILGSLVLALAAIQTAAMLQGNYRLLELLGLIEGTAGLLYAMFIVGDDAPAALWIVVVCNLGLGAWMISAARARA